MTINKKTRPSDEQFERELLDALSSSGWLLPCTEEQVEEIDKLVAQLKQTLPTELLTPRLLFEKESSKRYLNLNVANRELEASALHEARVARGEGSLTPPILSKMAEDRRKAEGQRKRK